MIKLSTHLRRLIVVLVAGISLALLLMLGSYFYGLQYFQKSEQRSTTQLLALIDMQQQYVQANRLFEHRGYQPNDKDHAAVATMWANIWQQYAKLLPDYQEAVLPNLVRLELGHWRLLDIFKQGLHKSDRAVFEQLITPQITQLFEVCTQLVNMARDANSLPALGYAADMRGYLTKASQALSLTQRPDAGSEWLDYFDAMQAFQASHSHLAQLKPLVPAMRRLHNDLYRQAERLQANAFVLKRLGDRHQYFNVDRQLAMNQHVTASLERELDALFRDVRLTREDLREQATQRFIWTCAVIIIALLVLVLSLDWWRRRLSRAIVEPIQEIVDNSHRIATAQTTEITALRSNLVEMQQLTEAVTLIRDIVKGDQHRVHQQQVLQEGVETLNAMVHDSENLSDFCQQSLALLVAQSGALAGALFLKTQPGAHQEPLLCAQVNISAELERHYRQNFDGLPCHVFQNRVKIEEQLAPGEVRIYSSVSERAPAFHCLLPVDASHETLGVVELLFASREAYPAELVKALVEKLAVLLHSLLSTEHTRELLSKTQKQKQLLDDAMTELKSQTHALQQSEAELEMQADELKVNNLELRRQAETSEKQKRELEKLNERLHLATRELQEASNQKTAFLSKVSHELRTPLNSIMVLTQVLLKQDNTLTEEQKQSLTVIRNSGEDLLTLVNDLLDLARIEAGKMKFHFEPLRIRDLTNRLKAQFDPIAQQKGLSWHVSVADDVPDTLVSDVQRLAQVLRNFLSNAFKFTGAGKVLLKVTTQGSYIVFDVEDSGIGISREDQALIFESFSQVDAPVGPSQSGSGLGLSIARQIAESLGGYITLASQKGEGSHFALYVPLEVQVENGLADKVPAASKQAGSAEVSGHEAVRVAPPVVSSAAIEVEPNKPPPRRWCLVDEDASELQAFQQLFGEHIAISQCTVEAFLETLPDDLQGVILRGDQVFGDHKKALQDRLEAMHHSVTLVALVDHALHDENSWLAGVAHHLIRWNDAGRDQLLKIVLPNASKPVEWGEEPAAETRDGTGGADSEPAYLSAGVGAQSGGSGKHVLLLDDDMRSLFSTGMALRQAGYVTELADSVALAKQKLQAFPAEMVVTDLVLPGEDGFAFIEYLKQHSLYQNLPVIVLSAKDSQEDKQHCEALGINAYIPKPVSLKDLLDAMAQALGAPQSAPEDGQQNNEEGAMSGKGSDDE